jgi:WD40 repeat protein
VLRSSFFRRVAAAGCVLALALAASAGAQLSGSFGKNKIQYRHFVWKTYKSPHFMIYYYEDEEKLLEKVVSFGESAYDRLSLEFDHQIQEPIPLIFYATHSAFEQNNIIPNFIPEGIGAFASPVRNRMVMPVDLPDGELFELIMHELTHVFQYSVIFQSKFGRGLATGAPQWFMEGMASYMAKDEGTIEKMFLRDAVVNDNVPSILQRGVGGYMSYRFGHAAFDYIEERWGKEGFRDFVYEFRNTIGGRPEKAIERALRIKPEDFDLDFRRWLRKKYLPELVATGEPSDFGRPFRDEKGDVSQAISPAASPSGDLVAALAVSHGDLDVVLYDARERKPIANLTKGFSDRYQYLVSQNLTAKARMGRDLAFSPDGNRIAVFAKREKGRSLLIFDVLRKKIERIVDMDVEQQHAPAFSSDGRMVAFSGNRAGRFDIFLYDLESGAITNLTDDEGFDGAPVFTPDGQSLVYSSTVGYDHAQLWRLELSGERRRTRLTEGPWSDQDAVFSSDGKQLFFTSDRSGTFNIWGLELSTGKATQYTNAITGCIMPTVQKGKDGRDRLVYAGFWQGDFDLYMSDLEQPAVAAAKTEAPPAGPGERESLGIFEPDIQVSIDPANQEKYKRSRLFLEDGGGSVGFTDDQYVLGQAYLNFTDYLGNRRLFALLSSVDTFSDFDFLYIDLSKRTNWSVELFDRRSFFIGFDDRTGRRERGQAAFRLTGAVGSLVYPISFYHRFETGAGFIVRDYQFQQVQFDDQGNEVFRIDPRKDQYPIVQAALVGDTTVYDFSGPVSGRRWRLSANYGYDTDGGGTLSAGAELDFRQYLHLSDRTQIAIRAFGGFANGSFPNVYAVGGLDTLRGFDFRSLVGDRVFFTNLEFRFPLIDALAGPFFDFRGIRGRMFLDVGGAWRDYAGDSFHFWDNDTHRLRDGLSAYGWGFTVEFAGLELNWDFAQSWDFKDSIDGGFRTSFWIGSRF